MGFIIHLRFYFPRQGVMHSNLNNLLASSFGNTSPKTLELFQSRPKSPLLSAIPQPSRHPSTQPSSLNPSTISQLNRHHRPQPTVKDPTIPLKQGYPFSSHPVGSAISAATEHSPSSQRFTAVSAESPDPPAMDRAVPLNGMHTSTGSSPCHAATRSPWQLGSE